MTVEEAINNLTDYWRLEERVAFDIAIKALEKQIPRKPFGQDPNHLCGHCPDCGHLVKRWMNNCPHCGKALDWSEIEKIINDESI